MEIWKDIPGYEGIYQASNMGEIRSLSRKSWNGKVWHPTKGRILKQNINRYKQVSLNKDNKRRTWRVHVLVAMAFLNHTPNGNTLVVDHIDDNKMNNLASNLKVITNRSNTVKNISTPGISWHKRLRKFQVRKYRNGKRVLLGYTKTLAEAKIILGE